MFVYGFWLATMLIASLHGFILSGILFFNSRFNIKANRHLAISILMVSIILMYEWMYFLEETHPVYLFLYLLPVYISALMPFGLYHFVAYSISPDKEYDRFYWISLFPALAQLAIELTRIPCYLLLDQSSMERLEVWLEGLNEGLGVVTSFVFIIMAMRMVNQYTRDLLANYSTLQGKDISWMKLFFIPILIAMTFWLLEYSTVSLGEYSEFFSILVSLSLATLMYVFGYFVLLRTDLFEAPTFAVVDTSESATPKKLSDKMDDYYRQLLAIMEDQKPYMDVDLTLTKLSEMMDLSPSYLSQIINSKVGKNFFEFVNAYRIEAIKQKLTDPNYEHFSILGIAYECGFKTKSTFNTVFKNVTGYTPSAYKRQVQESRMSA